MKTCALKRDAIFAAYKENNQWKNNNTAFKQLVSKIYITKRCY